MNANPRRARIGREVAWEADDEWEADARGTADRPSMWERYCPWECGQLLGHVGREGRFNALLGPAVELPHVIQACPRCKQGPIAV